MNSQTPLNPLVTIVTVTYNAGATLPATLRSIERQTCNLYEFILIDGNSKDNTVELAKQSSVLNKTIVSEPDHGLYDAMNKALGIAKGDYVMFLNAGDSLHSDDTLQQIADAILENDYPGVVYGQTDIVDAERHRIGSRHLSAPENLTLDSFKDGMLVCHQAFIALRKLTDNFSPFYKYSADYKWCINILQRSHRNTFINDVIVDYLDEGVTSRHRFASLWERFCIMCKYYGVMPTVGRHFKFFIRNLKRKS